MYIGDSRVAERTREILSVELRIVPRARNGANVDESRNAVCFQQTDEFIDRPRGVTDRENGDSGVFDEGTGAWLHSGPSLSFGWRLFSDCATWAGSGHDDTLRSSVLLMRRVSWGLQFLRDGTGLELE